MIFIFNYKINSKFSSWISLFIYESKKISRKICCEENLNLYIRSCWGGDIYINRIIAPREINLNTVGYIKNIINLLMYIFLIK